MAESGTPLQGGAEATTLSLRSVSAASTETAGTPSLACAAAEQRVHELLAEVEELAPVLSEATAKETAERF